MGNYHYHHHGMLTLQIPFIFALLFVPTNHQSLKVF